MFKRQSQVPVHAALGVGGYPHTFLEALGALEQKAEDTPSALVILSIDNLAMIMSGYSMAVAEAVMSEVHGVIAGRAGAANTMRIQRDQFGVLFSGLSENDIAQWCHMIEEAIRAYSYNSRYGELHCLTSTAYQIIRKGCDVGELLARTLVALDDDEESVIPNTDVSGAEHREEMAIANFLGQAVEERRVRLAFQPVIAATSGEVAHYEALLRLYGEDGKISSAGALIPIAERMGFAPMIDKLVLSQVIDELRHAKNVSLAVNVSNHSALDPGWMSILKDAMLRTPDIAPRLIIELTETAVHRDLKHMALFCAEIQGLGCSVTLDDFGSGYTSFRQLKTLSVDYVKIDGSFIKDLSENSDSRFFVKTLLDFTRGFGLRAVAECVENGEVAKILMDLGVDYFQGFYFGKPMNHRKWLNEGEYGN